MIRVFACSSNPGKLREFDLAATELGCTNIQMMSLPNLKDIEPPEEVGHTFEANASDKACYYSRFTSDLVLADDSGLEVDALGGAPGVFSARYATPHLQDRHAQDAANNRLLLENMRHQQTRAARFVCVIALAQQGQTLETFRGRVEGELLREESGSQGFGYDPLFFYPPFHCSFAQLDGPRKFQVSHRGSALRQAVTWIDRLAQPDEKLR